jgi:hypothetical protein
VALYDKHLSFGVLMIRHTYYANLSATFNDGIQDVARRALAALCKEICQDHRDKQVKRVTEKYTKKLEGLRAWVDPKR